MKKKLRLGFVSDHGGFLLKSFLKSEYENDFQIYDFGTDSETSVDYPPLIQNACKKILQKEIDFLFAFCGTGIGVSITANRFKNIRAALCHDVFTAEMSRKHNDANVLVLGGRVIKFKLALEISRKWLETDFEFGRHQKRLELIELI